MGTNSSLNVEGGPISVDEKIDNGPVKVELPTAPLLIASENCEIKQPIGSPRCGHYEEANQL